VCFRCCVHTDCLRTPQSFKHLGDRRATDGAHQGCKMMCAQCWQPLLQWLSPHEIHGLSGAGQPSSSWSLAPPPPPVPVGPPPVLQSPMVQVSVALLLPPPPPPPVPVCSLSVGLSPVVQP
jgi:hypothetical protein